MGNKPCTLSDFQREKLSHEFKTFYDRDGDGVVTWEDFQLAKERVCGLNRWEANSDKALSCEELYVDVWTSLRQLADKDKNDQVTSDEWMKMWELELGKLAAIPNPTIDNVPLWMYRYLLHRFHVIDRTDDGVIDKDEYEYVMSEFFNVPLDECRKAWLIFTQNNEIKVNFERFCTLASDYFFSNDPAAPGNFVMGRIRFDNSK